MNASQHLPEPNPQGFDPHDPYSGYQDAGYGTPKPGGAMEMNLWDMVRQALWSIRKRAWVVVLVFALAMGASLFWLQNTPKFYRAVGKLMVAPRIANPAGGDAYSDADGRFYATQTELLNGPTMQNRVLAKLSEFRDSKGEIPKYKLVAQTPLTSNIFTVMVDSTNGRFAEAFVNTLFKEYIEFKSEQKSGLTGTAFESFTKEIAEKSEELRKAENELLEFKKANPSIYVEGSSQAQEKQMSELSNKVVELSTQIGLLKKMQDFFYKSQSAASAVENFRIGDDEARVLEQSGLKDLPWVEAKRDLEKLQIDYDSNLIKFKPQHPIMVDLEQKIQAARKRLDQEASTAETNFKQRLEEMELQLGVYKKAMDDLAQGNLQSVDKLTKLEQLQNVVDRTKRLYDELVSSLAKIATSVDITQTNMQIQEKAILVGKVSPDEPKTLITGALAGLAIGCGLVIMIDKLSNKVTTPEQVQGELGMDLLGVIPQVSLRIKEPSDRLYTAHDDQGGFAESFRTLRSLLVQRSNSEPMQVIQITSPQPGEGKSFVSGNLAVALAEGGMNVLLVSADLRRGDVHRAFGIKRDPGLAEVLQRRSDWRSQLHATGQPTLHFISSGAPPEDAARLLQSSMMRELVHEWRQHYDKIVVDCPPLVAVSDAVILAPLCDATFVVLRSETTPCRVAMTALDILSRRAHPASGAILNAIDLRRGYYPSYGYYRYHNADYTYGGSANGAKVKSAKPAVGSQTRKLG